MSRLIQLGKLGIIVCFITIGMLYSCKYNVEPILPDTFANDDKAVLSTLFHQNAAEYHALCLQSYNIAKLRLTQELNGKKANWKKSIITDLDETAINNSDFFGWLYFNDTVYDASTNWAKYVKLQEATPIPGSVAFFRYADSMEVNVYYVSNRSSTLLKATRHNLEALDFPQTDVEDHMLFMSNKEDTKAKRREIIRNIFPQDPQSVILLLGDQLDDFQVFYNKGKPNEDIKTKVDKIKEYWGHKFIMLPNVMYGNWDFSLYDYQFSKSIQYKDSMRLLKMRSIQNMQKIK